MKTTVIYHRADYDGIFCYQIAKLYLGTDNVDYIGWDHGDAPLSLSIINESQQVYILDLPVDRPFGVRFPDAANQFEIAGWLDGRIIWIDHHKSAIETHSVNFQGYRIDGVAACRLAWQWFYLRVERNTPESCLPEKWEFEKRELIEPLAVRLAGEYDIWDHRDDDADVAFQFGLDSQFEIPWPQLLQTDWGSKNVAETIVSEGRSAMRCYAARDAVVIRDRSFIREFEGLKFLVLNTARCNSNTFAAKDVPETGHDALMAFYYNGQCWTFSLYHANHRKDLDLSLIASKYGGGGHRGACGFRTNEVASIFGSSHC